MWHSLPAFGTATLYSVLVVAAYTFAVALAAGRGHPRLLRSARLGAYATAALIGLGVVLLAYAFVTHDFRIRYVARYSDRTMTTTYLLTSLWGGQDGSLLWWSALLSIYVSACVRWMKGRYRQLQPYVIATLMVVIAFFAVLMIFAANPFQTAVTGAPPEGEGLNPLLQNYWMIIHPPMLYSGFVGCTIPFAFAVAAMVTGRLDNEWIVAVRKWMLVAFLFLSIGNVLGMVWAYEELGWGGFWAWDPVENAAVLPWFTAAAYVHSTMIQERRNMLKLWNIVLICITFFLTIFGTFLTRSGLIASVHSFAQSDIGIFFVWAMGLIVAVSAALIVWRTPQLRSRTQIESLASREAMFVINNWALLGAATFVAVLTLLPKLSEWVTSETMTVGPPYFNRWMTPLGLLIFALMGLAPLFGWRKTSKASLKKAFSIPLGIFVATAAAHLAFGEGLGYPAIVASDEPFPGIFGGLIDGFGSLAPLLTIALASFNVAVVAQEFAFGVTARRLAAEHRGESEGVFVALARLVGKSRRRYGGYVVHLGIIAMFLGFVGSAWSLDREATLMPDESFQLGDYDLTYRGTRTCPGDDSCSPEEQADLTKRMIFAVIDVKHDGHPVGRLEPAKFIYHRSTMGPTTEVALRRGMAEDLYMIVGSIDPNTKKATFQFHINPFVSWIWVGLLTLILGCSVSLWPEVRFGRIGVWAYLRASTGVAAGVGLALWMASAPARPHAGELPSASGERAQAAMATAAPPGYLEALGQAPWSLGMVVAPLAGVVVGSGQLQLKRREKKDDSA